MRALLDINVLIALLDAQHVHHSLAARWLSANIDAGWASCPLTQNGVIRIMSQPAYPIPVPPGSIAGRLSEAVDAQWHEFWADDLSLLDAGLVRWSKVLGSRQITDCYLLALAVHRGGRLVTFDRRISPAAVQDAESRHLLLIDEDAGRR